MTFALELIIPEMNRSILVMSVGARFIVILSLKNREKSQLYSRVLLHEYLYVKIHTKKTWK